MIKIGLIQFPGSNCERETALAIKRAGMEPVEFLWNEPLEKLASFDGYVLIGGFSYEDRSRAGIIAALDPVIQTIKQQSEKGKPVLGICNGAQILIEAGMLPGLTTTNTELALTENKRLCNGKVIGVGFYNAWVNMRLTTHYQDNAFTSFLSNKDIIHLPVAHAEGRFLLSDTLLAELQKNGMNIFQYCDDKGNIIDNFPINPNGSVNNIAAITNKAGNIMAMMPHPERTINGDPIFASMREYISNDHLHVKQVSFQPVVHTPKPPVFKKLPSSHEWVVQLIITDNHALTVQNTLRKLGFPVTVNRFIHWEIDTNSQVSLEQIKKSSVLFCDRKEGEISLSKANSKTTRAFLIREKDDVIGQQAAQTLQHHFSVDGIRKIVHGIIWQFTSEQENINELISDILLTNIIRNPCAHESYEYVLCDQ